MVKKKPSNQPASICSPSIHQLVIDGNLSRLKELLEENQSKKSFDINAYDQQGRTPLMYAVKKAHADLELIQLLIDHGAEINIETGPLSYGDYRTYLMALALGAGDPEVVRLLIEKGGNIHYLDKGGYGAIVSAAYSRDIWSDSRLIDLINLLIAQRVDLNIITSCSETSLRALSGFGRFDAVKTLLDAGADVNHLQWTPLMLAIAVGTVADVEREIAQKAPLEMRDWSERTAWLLAVHTGNIAKAQLLYDAGVEIGSRGRCDKPAVFYAIENHHLPMLSWLVEIGADIEDTDEFRDTPLIAAAEYKNPEAVELLLKLGANPNRGDNNGQTALDDSTTGEVARRLLDAGANPGRLPFEARRSLLGLESDPAEGYLYISHEEYVSQRARKFGTGNPQKFKGRLYDEMVRTGMNAYRAGKQFDEPFEGCHPIWCAQRFGQSIIFLPDQRIIQIGGEHEDHYDPDFCIYNDVFVHHPGGSVEFFGYPEEAFPPTDFHTATLLGERFIWIIGSLGYAGTRRYGETAVYRLDTGTYQIDKIETKGPQPGWIYKHTATVISGEAIRISGGKTVSLSDDKEIHLDNDRSFILDTRSCVWSRCDD